MHRNTHRARLLLLLVLLLGSSVHADHEIDHRYTVRGYVVDGQDRPIAGALVSAESAGERDTGRTDDAGYYTITMHLHDSDVGREIRLRTGEATATIRMQAEVGNQHTQRIHWASFVDGRLQEENLGRFKMPVWAWVLIIVAAATALLTGGVKLQNASLRRRKAAQRSNSADGHSARKKKGKRGERKKRRG